MTWQAEVKQQLPFSEGCPRPVWWRTPTTQRIQLHIQLCFPVTDYNAQELPQPLPGADTEGRAPRRPPQELSVCNPPRQLDICFSDPRLENLWLNLSYHCARPNSSSEHCNAQKGLGFPDGSRGHRESSALCHSRVLALTTWSRRKAGHLPLRDLHALLQSSNC